MNIVLDTNVLVAGLLSPFGPCGQIVRMVSSGELTLSFDARILAEYEEFFTAQNSNLKKTRLPHFLIISNIAGSWPLLLLSPVHFQILMTTHFWK